MLSPQVGGGHFVSHQRLGEVAYVSEELALTPADILAAGVGPPERQRMLASVYALALVRNEQVEATCSLEDLVSGSILRLAVSSSLDEAEALVDLLVPARGDR